MDEEVSSSSHSLLSRLFGNIVVLSIVGSILIHITDLGYLKYFNLSEEVAFQFSEVGLQYYSIIFIDRWLLLIVIVLTYLAYISQVKIKPLLMNIGILGIYFVCKILADIFNWNTELNESLDMVFLLVFMIYGFAMLYTNTLIFIEALFEKDTIYESFRISIIMLYIFSAAGTIFGCFNYGQLLAKNISDYSYIPSRNCVLIRRYSDRYICKKIEPDTLIKDSSAYEIISSRDISGLEIKIRNENSF